MSTFQATGLYPEILKAVSDLGFKDPTPIQEKAIPFLLGNDKDLIALAQTGTGKTAAFGLPLIHLTDPSDRYVQGLILCPTRELCLQIASDLASFAKHMPKVRIVPIYGGANINQQIKFLRQGAQIVVGTPGRTLDLIRRGDLDIGDINVMVLDEADEMLDRGFKHDLDAILATAPRHKRTWLFSATMPDEIARISRQYLYSPERISVGKVNSGAENVSHEYYIYPKKGRYGFLKELLRAYGDVYGIVFCRTKRKAREVARRLQRDGFSAEALQGDMSQAQRDRAMARFRSGKARLLIATDVAARGVDIDDLTHVINFNLSDVDEVYIHRSGRTGRAKRSGVSIAILDEEELGRIKPLERLARKKFTRKQLSDVQPMDRKGSNGEDPDWPSATNWHEEEQHSSVDKKDVHYKAVYDKLDEIMSSETKDKNLERQFPLIHEYLEGVEKEELINRLVSYLGNKGAFKSKPAKQKQKKEVSAERKQGGRQGKKRNNKRRGGYRKSR